MTPLSTNNQFHYADANKGISVEAMELIYDIAHAPTDKEVASLILLDSVIAHFDVVDPLEAIVVSAMLKKEPGDILITASNLFDALDELINHPLATKQIIDVIATYRGDDDFERLFQPAVERYNQNPKASHKKVFIWTSDCLNQTEEVDVYRSLHEKLCPSAALQLSLTCHQQNFMYRNSFRDKLNAKGIEEVKKGKDVWEIFWSQKDCRAADYYVVGLEWADDVLNAARCPQWVNVCEVFFPSIKQALIGGELSVQEAADHLRAEYDKTHEEIMKRVKGLGMTSHDSDVRVTNNIMAYLFGGWITKEQANLLPTWVLKDLAFALRRDLVDYPTEPEELINKLHFSLHNPFIQELVNKGEVTEDQIHNLGASASYALYCPFVQKLYYAGMIAVKPILELKERPYDKVHPAARAMWDTGVQVLFSLKAITADEILNLTDAAGDALLDPQVRALFKLNLITMNEILNLTDAASRALRDASVRELFNLKLITMQEILNLTDEESDVLHDSDAQDIIKQKPYYAGMIVVRQILEVAKGLRDASASAHPGAKALRHKKLNELFYRKLLTWDDIFNMTEAALYALQDRGVRELFHLKLITMQEILHLTDAESDTLCDPNVQNLIKKEGRNPQGIHYFLAHCDLFDFKS